LIVVIANDPSSSITSVVDSQSHLTFTQVASGGGGNGYFIFTAPLSGASLLGDTITVTGTTSQARRVNVLALANYHTASPQDPNAAIPNAVLRQCSWTTSNENDFLFGISDSNNTSADSGRTLLVPSSFPSTALFFSEGKIRNRDAVRYGSANHNQHKYISLLRDPARAVTIRHLSPWLSHGLEHYAEPLTPMP
jgi:hypothetical protein